MGSVKSNPKKNQYFPLFYQKLSDNIFCQKISQEASQLKDFPNFIAKTVAFLNLL